MPWTAPPPARKPRVADGGGGAAAGRDVAYWHDADIQECLPNVGYCGQSGQHLLDLSFTDF
jgi:hypothetical protein